MTGTQNIAAQELKSFIERIERLEEERKSIADDIKDVKAEAKGRGYDVTAINTIIRLRKKDANERMEQEAILDTYMIALGMLPEPTLFDEPHDAETGELSPRLAKQVVNGMQTEAGRKALLTAVDIMIERAEAEEITPSDVTPRPDTAVTTPSDSKGQAAPSLSTHSLETATEVPAQDSGGTGLGESLSGKSKAARPASVDAHVNDGRLAGQASDEVVTVVGTESGTVTSSPEQAPEDTASHGGAGYHSADSVNPVGGSVAASIGGDHVNSPDISAAQAGASVRTTPATPLRPHCLQPGVDCGDYGSNHCARCLRAAGKGEAA